MIPKADILTNAAHVAELIALYPGIGVPRTALRCTVREFHREAASKTIDPETVLVTNASTQEGGRRMIPATIRPRQNFSVVWLCFDGKSSDIDGAKRLDITPINTPETRVSIRVPKNAVLTDGPGWLPILDLGEKIADRKSRATVRRGVQPKPLLLAGSRSRISRS